MFLIIVLNVVLCGLVFLTIVGLHVWAVWTSNPREELPSIGLDRIRRALKGAQLSRLGSSWPAARDRARA